MRQLEATKIIKRSLGVSVEMGESLFLPSFMVFSKQVLADVGKFVGRDHNKRLLEDRVAIVCFCFGIW